MGNDSYALTNMNVKDIPIVATGEAAAGDYIIFYDTSAGGFKRRLAPTTTQAEDNILDGVTATSAELNYNDIATLGTGAASKAVVLSATANYTLPTSHTFRKGLVALTATTVITALLHSNRVNYITGTAAATYTLPEATGTGDSYYYVIGEVNTNGTVIVVADTTNANFIGNILTQDADLVGTIATLTHVSPSNSDTITLNGTTKGGAKGDWIEIIDVATDVWFVTGITSVPAGSNTATPFSAAV